MKLTEATFRSARERAEYIRGFNRGRTDRLTRAFSTDVYFASQPLIAGYTDAIHNDAVVLVPFTR